MHSKSIPEDKLTRAEATKELKRRGGSEIGATKYSKMRNRKAERIFKAPPFKQKAKNKSKRESELIL